MNNDQYWTVDEVNEQLELQVGNKVDGVCAVCGEEGIGKSALTRVLARKNCIKRGVPFDLEKITYYSKKKLMDDIDSTRKGIFIYDEAIDSFSRDWNKKEQKAFIKMLKTIRANNHIMFMNIPIFWELDKGARNRCQWYIYVDKRFSTGSGRAVIYQKEKSAWNTDLWNQRENLKYERKGRMTHSKNFRGWLHIEDYSDKQWFVEMEAKADEIKEAKKAEVYKDDTIGITPTQVVTILNKIRPYIEIPHGHLRRVAELFDIHYSTFKDQLYLQKTTSPLKKL